MYSKYVIVLYVQHWGREPQVRREMEFNVEPDISDIKIVVDEFEPQTWDYEIDYSTGAVLPDYAMPQKCKIEKVYAVVEKRYYKELTRCRE
jgi:hypothetical protein